MLIRAYTPLGNALEDGWPIVVYYHGGGWVLANLDTYDASCRTLSIGSGAVVVLGPLPIGSGKCFPRRH
jgi:acetyl esterase